MKAKINLLFNTIGDVLTWICGIAVLACILYAIYMMFFEELIK
jgi:uncharacterized membrane protein (DUF373 family)